MTKKFKVGSLFAGVGGVCLGFQQAAYDNKGYEIAWANEIDEYACETYRTNFKHTLIEGDIRYVLNPDLVLKEIITLQDEIDKLDKQKDKVDEKELKKINKKISDNKKEMMKLEEQSRLGYYQKMKEQILSEKIDILNGGFPCQAFSIAGEQKGFNDERGNLFLSIIELIKQLGEKFEKPRILLLENVKNLKSHDKGNTYKVIKSKLEEVGYKIYESVINTMDYTNLPQNRERIYIVGFLNDEDANKFQLFSKLESNKVEKTPEDRANDIKQIIDYTLQDDAYYYTKEKYPHYFIDKESFKDVEDTKKNIRINLEEQINEAYQFYQLRRGQYVRKNKSNVCPTLTANMGTGGHNVPLIKVEKGIRKITPTESFRLQGFPVGKGYTLPAKFKTRKYPDSRLYKQAGNAVSVPVVKMLTEYILSVLD